jgi:hypothetical protein
MRENSFSKQQSDNSVDAAAEEQALKTEDGTGTAESEPASFSDPIISNHIADIFQL